MQKYLVLIERAADGKYGAHVPDLPGCAVCGYDTLGDARNSIATALEMHIKGIIEDCESVPKPVTRGDYVETSVA